MKNAPGFGEGSEHMVVVAAPPRLPVVLPLIRPTKWFVRVKVAGKVGVCDHFDDARGGHFKEAFFANIITNVPSATRLVMV